MQATTTSALLPRQDGAVAPIRGHRNPMYPIFRVFFELPTQIDGVKKLWKGSSISDKMEESDRREEEASLGFK